MRKVFVLLTALLVILCGCAQEPSAQGADVFTKSENGSLISSQGVEYAHLANEGILYYLGETEFEGSVQGEEKASQHMGYSYQTGMFSIKNAENDNILIRRAPDNEWFMIYRRASLPAFDFSPDNCIRLEFVSGTGDTEKDAIHKSCGEGITDSAEISAFLSEVRGKKSPREAGLYELIKKPDGMLENCYVYGVIYGFFEEEPDLAVRMQVVSYNDLAYSVTVEGMEYVLPEAWLDRLQER